MSVTGRRGLLLAVSVVSAGGTFGAARVATRRYARDFAERSAVTIAGYLALVAPASKDLRDYDLPLLLIRARALETLPGWAPEFEVYHPTGPLVHATALPLSPGELSRLRREETPGWDATAGAVVAPLFDRDDWDVVGAVGVRAPRLDPMVLEWLVVAALVVAVGLAVPAVRAAGAEPGAARRPLARYSVAALLLALATYADVHAAARRATDGWLADTRMLVQEAAAGSDHPGSAALARAARGGELVAVDSGPADPGRGRRNGVFVATVAIRLGPGRWLELRTRAMDAAGGWLLVIIGLALLGPAVVWLGGWGASASRYPLAARESVAAWGFLAPALLHLAVFSIVPLLLLPYVSLHRWSPIELGPAFAGSANVVRLATDPRVWASLRATLVYLLTIPVTMALALAAALALPRRWWVGRAVASLLLAPYAASAVALALVCEWLDGPTLGLGWLGAPRTALVALMIVSLLTQLGAQVTVFQAGLAGIPSVYADAARIDGAGSWRRFWRVTFPLLRPVTAWLLVTGIAGASPAFTYIYLLTQGGPLDATDTLTYRVYQVGWRLLEPGYAGAIALLVLVLAVPVIRAPGRLLGKGVEYA